MTPQATSTLIDLLGMHAVGNTGNPTSRSAHQLLLAGTFITGTRALVRARMSMSSTGITMELGVRSESPEISRTVLEVIA
ncbi:MAG: hypothetical protein BJ554DRAFT_2448, partial [Olpidium bornovanus]